MSNRFWFLLIVSIGSAIAPYLPLIALVAFVVLLYSVPLIWPDTFSFLGSVIYWAALTALFVWGIWQTYRNHRKELEKLKEKDIECYNKEVKSNKDALKGGGCLLSAVIVIPICFMIPYQLTYPWGNCISIVLLLGAIVFGVFYINKDEKKDDSAEQ